MKTGHGREPAFLRRLMLRLGSRPDIRVFRNNVGLGFVGTVTAEDHGAGRITLKNYRRILFGLTSGSGDLIGWRSVTITPAMVGKRVAVFLSVEAKAATGKVRPDQENWRDQVRAAGGIAEIIREQTETGATQ